MKPKIINVIDLVTAYSAYIEAIFNRSIETGPESTAYGIDLLKGLLIDPYPDDAIVSPKKRPERPTPEQA